MLVQLLPVTFKQVDLNFNNLRNTCQYLGKKGYLRRR